jgi:hypothetical protein
VNTCIIERTSTSPEHQRRTIDEPATPTPSHHREHRGPLSHFFPPLAFLLYGGASP